MHVLRATSLAPLELVSVKSVQERAEDYRVEVEIRNPWAPEGSQQIVTATNVKKSDIQKIMKQTENRDQSDSAVRDGEIMGGEVSIDLSSELAQKITSFAVQSTRAQSAFPDSGSQTSMQVKKITSRVVNGVVYRVLLDVRTVGDAASSSERITPIEVTMRQALDGTFTFDDMQFGAEVSPMEGDTSMAPRHIPGGFKEINPKEKQVSILAGYAFAHHEFVEKTPKKLGLIDVERAFKQVVNGVIYRIILRVKDSSSNSITQQYLHPIHVWHQQDNTFVIHKREGKFWIPPTYSTTPCPKCKEIWWKISNMEYARCVNECTAAE